MKINLIKIGSKLNEARGATLVTTPFKFSSRKPPPPNAAFDVVSVEAQGCAYEQHISIIKNPSPGSGSLTHFAFPELHPNVGYCLQQERDKMMRAYLHFLRNLTSTKNLTWSATTATQPQITLNPAAELNLPYLFYQQFRKLRTFNFN